MADVPAASPRSDRRRLYAAVVFVPLFYVIVRYLPSIALFAVVAAAASLALIELYRLYFGPRSSTRAIALALVLALLVLSTFQWPGLVPLPALSCIIVGAILLFHLAAGHDLSRSLTDVSVLAFGILYIPVTLGHLLLTRALPDGVFLTFFVFLVTWAGDTGAYYTGMTLGRTRLAPVISPKKTVEGLVGGCVTAVASALVARAWFLPSISTLDAVVLGLLLTFAGLFGDLSESMFKRGAGMKDSGVLIPGHGGMLDRVDSLLFTAPTFYYYVTLVRTSP